MQVRYLTGDYLMTRHRLDETPAEPPPGAAHMDRRHRYPWQLAKHGDTFLLAVPIGHRTQAGFRAATTNCKQSWQAWKRRQLAAGVWTKDQAARWHLRYWAEPAGVRVKILDRAEEYNQPRPAPPAGAVPPIPPQDRGREIDALSPISQLAPVEIEPEPAPDDDETPYVVTLPPDLADDPEAQAMAAEIAKRRGVGVAAPPTPDPMDDW